jgi:hypothetical protein
VVNGKTDRLAQVREEKERFLRKPNTWLVGRPIIPEIYV